MKRTIKVLLGAAVLALIGVGTASAQTGTLQGQELYLYDGGTTGSGGTRNAIGLLTPADGDLTGNFSLILPPAIGSDNDIIVLTNATTGQMEFQNGLDLFWGTEGNCGTLTPWDPFTCTGNYIGTSCAIDLDIRSNGDFINFWFQCNTTPHMQLTETGTTIFNTGSGVEGIVIQGYPGLPPTDAGILIDCANPPTVGIEVNAIALGIAIPAGLCAPAPVTGIYLQGTTTGLEIHDSPTGLYIHTASTAAIDADGDIFFRSIPLDPGDDNTRVLTVDDATGRVEYRLIAAGDIITGGGTVNYLPLWTPSGTQLGNSIISQDGGATTATVTGDLTVTGGSDLRGTVTNTTGDLTLSDAIISITATGGDLFLRSGPGGADEVRINNVIGQNGGVMLGHNAAAAGIVALHGPDIQINPLAAGDLSIATLGNDETDVQLLSRDAVTGVISYRSIAAGGSIVTSNGPLTNNGNVYVNSSGQLESQVMTDGQLIIGSTGNAPVVASLTEGTGIDITTGPGSITISSEIPDGIANQTLRWDGGTSAWVASSALQNDGTDVTMTGSVNVNGSSVLGDAALDVVTINASTVDADNLPTSALSTNLVRRDATGNLQVSTALFPVAAGPLTPNRNVRTDGAGALTTGAINLAGGATEVTGILPIANGGTNSGAALNNNRIMVSSGGAIVEAAALTNGQLLIGSTGAAPVAASLTAGSGISITPGAGSITIAASGELLPTGTTTDATLRWDGSDWVENVNLRSTAAGNTTIFGTVTLDPADVANDETDTRVLTVDAGTGLVSYKNASGTIVTSSGALANNAAVHTNGSGQVTTATLTDGQFLIGSTGNAPAVGGITSSGSTITVSYASPNINLEVTNPLPAGANTNTLRHNGTNWVASGVLQNDGTDVTVTNDLTVGENTTLGDEDGDIASAQGQISLNTTTDGTQDVSVLINTAAHLGFNITTTIGANNANNTINLNSPTITAANLPAGTAGDDFVTQDVSGNLEVLAAGAAGYPWLIGGNAGATSSLLGTTTAVDVNLTSNNIEHIGLNNADASTDINTAVSTGNVNVGNTSNAINLNSDDIQMDNIPSNAVSTWILVYDNTTGNVYKRDLGTPVAQSVTNRATITGDGATQLFTFAVAGGFDVQAGAFVTLTLQDGTDGNDYTATVVAVDDANDEIDIRISGIMANLATKFVNYTVTNP